MKKLHRSVQSPFLSRSLSRPFLTIVEMLQRHDMRIPPPPLHQCVCIACVRAKVERLYCSALYANVDNPPLSLPFTTGEAIGLLVQCTGRMVQTFLRSQLFAPHETSFPFLPLSTLPTNQHETRSGDFPGARKRSAFPTL